VKEIIFWSVVGSVVLYDSLLIFSIATLQVRFWPPPQRPSWRRTVMRVVGPLGPLSVVGILVLGVLDADSFVWRHWSRLVGAGVLFLSGGAFALWGFFGLGVTASQGFGGPLLVSGAYRYSRNPQYVGTVAGLLGYGLLCNSLACTTSRGQNPSRSLAASRMSFVPVVC
jgi:protein-S-isoprenylcysteine O-methyltransferase Ste14